MNALKAQWVVQSGIIVGEPMHDLTRVWSYTSKHFSGDGDRRGAIFKDIQKQAYDHAASLEPSMNWVTLSYIWM